MDNIAKIIDHTMLKADASKNNIIKYCKEAKDYGFASVCVNSAFVPLVKKELEGSDVKTCCVVGFPLGAMSTRAKSYEAKIACEDGADEIDMVINISALKDEDYDYLYRDIDEVAKETHKHGAILKVIIETCLLTDEEKIIACKQAMKAKADFVKTSTGFSTGGATAEDIKLMSSVVGKKLGVKASGGIRNHDTAIKLIENGATRIGAGDGKLLIK